MKSIKIPKVNTAEIIQDAKKVEGENLRYTFKFEDGMVIRLLPYKHSYNPFISVYVKYVNKVMIYSPQNFGLPDPFFEKFSETGDKKVKPSTRFFCPCFIRGKEKEGVKFASFSQTQYLKIISFLEEVDLFDVTQGHDLVVKVKVKTGTMKEIDFMFKAKPSPAYIDMNFVEEQYDKQLNLLEDIIRPRLKSYEELTRLLNIFLSGREGEVGEIAGDDEGYQKHYDISEYIVSDETHTSDLHRDSDNITKNTRTSEDDEIAKLREMLS